MIERIVVRKEQAQAARKVLDDLALASQIASEAQTKADYLLAGILAGRVKGEVVDVDVDRSALIVEVEDDAAAA